MSNIRIFNAIELLSHCFFHEEFLKIEKIKIIHIINPDRYLIFHDISQSFETMKKKKTINIGKFHCLFSRQ